MAPSFIDNDSDFNSTAPPTTKESSMNARTLLLAPPSISSHEESLRNVLSTHDRSTTDLQMLDRLSAGLMTLPDSTYDVVLILTDADGTRTESNKLLGRDSFEKIVKALKAGGKLQAQDGAFGQNGGEEHREGILAGLVVEGSGMVKPVHNASEAMPLKLRRKPKESAVSDAGPPVPVPSTLVNGGPVQAQSKPAGVGFVDFSDDFDDPMITGEDDDDDELIDEDTLLTEEDMNRSLAIRKFDVDIVL
jgi:hypothetical protein